MTRVKPPPSAQGGGVRPICRRQAWGGRCDWQAVLGVHAPPATSSPRCCPPVLSLPLVGPAWPFTVSSSPCVWVLASSFHSQARRSHVNRLRSHSSLVTEQGAGTPPKARATRGTPAGSPETCDLPALREGPQQVPPTHPRVWTEWNWSLPWCIPCCLSCTVSFLLAVTLSALSVLAPGSLSSPPMQA